LGLFDTLKTAAKIITEFFVTPEIEKPEAPPIEAPEIERPPPPEFEELPEAPPEEPPPEKMVYRSIIITYDTEAGTNPRTGHSWQKTNIEITAEVSDTEDKIPSFTDLVDKTLSSIAKNEQWSWILQMDMKIGFENEEISMEKWGEIHVIIRRTTDYERQDEWTIQY
jgi:hypothetical protein